jgi:predicted RNA-binding protein YlxR (DUF448 family)
LKKKKIPLRKCIACGEGKPKKELIRVVRNNEKEVSIDITGKMNGRGAYICSNLECLELAQKGKKLSRTLEVEVPNDVYESLKDIIQSKLGK